MIYLLLLSLILLIILFFLTLGNDLVSPSIAFCLAFIISVCFLLIYSKTWNIVLHINIVFVIFFGILSLFIGEIVARSFVKWRYAYFKNTNIEKKFDQSILSVRNNITVVIITFMVFFLFWYFYYVYNIAASYGNSGGIITMLGVYRSISTTNELPMNIMLKLGVSASTSVGYFYIIVFFDNYIYGNKIYKKYLIPVVIYAVISILSSARIDILYLVIVFFYTGYIMYRRKNRWKEERHLNTFKYGLIVLVVFFIIFYLLGMLTGKSQMQNGFFQNISIYAGSSIAALDYYLLDYKYNIENFGSETLYGITNFLGILGLHIDLTGSRYLEFVHLGTMSRRTNIFTSFRRLLHDYGYIGMLIAQFFIGYIYTISILKIKHSLYKNEKLAILIYVFAFRHLVISFIDERVIVSLFTTTTLINIVLMVVLIKFVAEKKVL